MAGRTLVQRLRHRATQPAPLTRTFGVGGEAELVSPSTNIVRFLWEKAALVNLPWGIYDVELYFQDTGPTPDQEQIYGRGEILLRSPTTGTL
jgi:hypothetical protein